MTTEKKETFFNYKGRPLVRNGNTIYYGDMNEDYVCMLSVQSEKAFKGLSLVENIQVQMISTDPDTPVQDMVAKSSQRVGLYNALDIASIWLNRANTQE